MGTGQFKEDAPKGPKIGPVRDYKELSDEKKAEIGDPRIFQPVQVDPRVLAAEEAQAKTQVDDPNETQKIPRVTPEQVADELEALHTVVDEQDDEPDDDIDEEALPTEEDKRQFIRAIMGGESYAKVYDVCGGVMKVRLVDPWPVDQEKVFEQLERDVRDEVIKTQGDWETWYDRYQLVQRVHEITIAPSGAKTVMQHTPDLRVDFKNLVDQKRGTAAYQILMRVGRVFQRHVELLVERSLDSDFWTDDGPASPSEQ